MISHDAIADHLRYLEAAGYAETTRKLARSCLIRFDRELPMGILVAHPKEVEDLLAGPSRATTRAVFYDTLVRFYRWAVRVEWIDYDPSEGMPRPKLPRRVPRPAADHEVRIAVEEAAEPWRLYCRLAACAGLRCIEISRLDRADVSDPDGPGMLIRGKGSHERMVPTPPEVWELVESMPPGLLAGGRSAAWVSDATADYLHGTLHLRTTLHRFRAWYATTALAAGANLRTVQELLGHASVKTTEIYTLVTDEQKRAAVARMPRFGGL